MAEDLSEYYREVGLRVRYLHSEIDTLERVELIRGLRDGEFDVLVGINLLREGLDLPEVSLVGIMDADKEGFLRSQTSLIQTIGRAARNIHGRVILYADQMTDSIKGALDETNRRRKLQQEFNLKHNITPTTVQRAPQAELVEVQQAQEALGELADFDLSIDALPKKVKEVKQLIDQLRSKMFALAKEYEFEKAAVLRDRIALLEKYLLTL
jgi:excinuclease ABC subunit B